MSHFIIPVRPKSGLSLMLQLLSGLSWWCFHIHVWFSQCDPFSPNQPSLISLRSGREEESNRGEDFATGFPSPAFLLPSACLLNQKIMYVFCSLLHYVVCISRSYFHCVLKLISLCFFLEWIMECLCTSATCRIYGVLTWAFLVEGHSRQLRFDIIFTPHVCLYSECL